MLLAIGLSAAIQGFTDVDTTLKPNEWELDIGSYVYHWDRSEDWNEGFDNHWVGFQRSVDQANVYIKGAVFENSYGDLSGILGTGVYFDDTGRYKQGIEFGFPIGYDDEAEHGDIFIGYSGRIDITNKSMLKLHINPVFGGLTLSFEL